MIRLLPILLLLVSNGYAQTSDALVDTERLHSMVVDNGYNLEAGKQAQFTIIDIRPSEGYHQGHIAGAINMPAQDFHVSSPSLPPDRRSTIVLYGDQTDLEASLTCRTKLIQSGFTNVFVYSKAFSVWKELHLPIVQRIGTTP